MSEQNQQAPETGTGETTPATSTVPAGPDELTVLKQRARAMGITFSNNIGVDALREKVNAKIQGQPDPAAEAPKEELNPLAGDEAGNTPVAKKSKRRQQMDEQLKLVRVRITNLDPRKKDLPGEVFCVGNELIGTVKKFIPYGEVTDNGYHIPYILYKELDSRKFLNIRTRKNRVNGQIIVETSWAKEFAFEVLPQLTREELAQLAAAQAAGNKID